MQPHALVTTVKPPRNLAQIRRILRNFRIEQHERHIADPEHPDRREELPVNQRNADGDPVPLLVPGAHQRQIVNLRNRIMFDLPAVPVEDLGKVSLTIEQTYRNQRQREVARRFQVVSGENAETAGKNRNAFVDAEFQRKIGDIAFLRLLVFRYLPLKIRLNDTQMTTINRIARKLLEPRLRHGPQKQLGIAAEFAPQIRVNAHEQLDRHRMPAPPDVVGKRFQKIQLFRNARSDIV